MLYDELRRPAWNGGQIMAFSALDGVTDYDGALTARTAFDAPGLDITLPARGRIRFPGVTRADNLVAGDWFRFGGEHPTVGVFLDTHHLLVEGPCAVSHAEPGIACSTEGDRTLIGSSAHFDPGKIAADVTDAVRDRCRWLESLRLPAVRSRAARRTLIKALSTMKTQVYSPEGRIRHRWTTPDRWPHRQMWLWDSAFHAIGWRHIAPEVAQDAIRAVFDMQAPTGFIPHMMSPAGTSPITQPPVLAMSAKLVHEIEDAFEKHGTLFEFYDDRGEVPPFQLLRKGKCAPDESPYHQVFHDYGWTASLYVDLAYAGASTAPARLSKDERPATQGGIAHVVRPRSRV